MWRSNKCFSGRDACSVDDLRMTAHEFFFFKQKTAYEMRISDWSSDVCSSDLRTFELPSLPFDFAAVPRVTILGCGTAYLAGMVAKYWFEQVAQIGRASCRERVCQYV